VCLNVFSLSYCTVFSQLPNIRICIYAILSVSRCLYFYFLLLTSKTNSSSAPTRHLFAVCNSGLFFLSTTPSQPRPPSPTTSVTDNLTVLIMVALCNRADHYIFILFLLLLLLLLLLSFFFPRLISAVEDWMSTILRHMVWS